MIAAFNEGKIMAPMIFEGYCDTDFLIAGSNFLLVILDNATFHRKQVNLLKVSVLKLYICLHILLILIKPLICYKKLSQKEYPAVRTIRKRVIYEHVLAQTLFCN